MWPTWGSPGSRRPQVGLTLAPWILLLGVLSDGTWATIAGATILTPCHVVKSLQLILDRSLVYFLYDKTEGTSPGSQCLGWYPGTLLYNQGSGNRPSNELQRFDLKLEEQDRGSNCRQRWHAIVWSVLIWTLRQQYLSYRCGSLLSGYWK